MQLVLVQFPIMVVINALEQLPELLLGLLDKDAEFFAWRSAMGTATKWVFESRGWLTIVGYLSVTVRVDALEDILQEVVRIFQGCGEVSGDSHMGSWRGDQPHVR